LEGGEDATRSGKDVKKYLDEVRNGRRWTYQRRLLHYRMGPRENVLAADVKTLASAVNTRELQIF
jgi:hypothetical protein